MNDRSIIVSNRAERVLPGLTKALSTFTINVATPVHVLAFDEAPDAACTVQVGHDATPAFEPSDGAPATVRCAADDIGFAAALIAALVPGPVAIDPSARRLVALAERIAGRDIDVLINGPTGSGKEVLARHIHTSSPRRDRPFVAVNCAALPDSMLDAMLFGHERGAFTGAHAAARGLFRAADGGTLLLDEIAELPLPMQAKLLRVLQEREVMPIGSTSAAKIDVRVIACANRDLAAEVAAGRFRADLFYRLAVLPLTTLPLVARRADIVPIAAALWLRHGLERWPTPAALARLFAHDWPGNVRELGNVLQRAALLGDDRIDADDIVFDHTTTVMPATTTLPGQRQAAEFATIRSALANCTGGRAAAARRLGISERTLRYKLAAMAEARAPAATIQ